MKVSTVIQGNAMMNTTTSVPPEEPPNMAGCTRPQPQHASKACSHTLEQSSRLAGGAVAGQYLLTSFTEQRTRYGSPFLKCLLEDSTGQMAAYVWEKSGLIDQVRSFAT